MTLRLPGSPIRVRRVTPSPPATAAQRPPTLGLVRAIRHGILAASSARVAAVRNRQGASNRTNGSGVSMSCGAGMSRGPIQCICAWPRHLAYGDALPVSQVRARSRLASAIIPSNSVLRAILTSRLTLGQVLTKRRRMPLKRCSPKSSCRPRRTVPALWCSCRVWKILSLSSSSRRAWLSKASPVAVNARPRPDLASTGIPTCSSSFFSWALTAEVERPSRSAALAKLLSSTPVTKVRNTSRSKAGRRMGSSIKSGLLALLNLIFGNVATC